MGIGVVFCAGLAALIGFVGEIWQLYLVYILLGVASGSSTGVTTNAIMTRWFIRRRAFAMSISSTGVSVGGVVLSPLISKLIDIGDVRLAAPVMGVLVLAVAVPVVLLVLSGDPADMGLKPDGNGPPPEGSERQNRLLDEASQRRRWTFAEARRTIGFWAILLAFLLALTAQTGFVFHQISFLEERFGSRDTAAFALSVTAFGSIVARLLVGRFADFVDKRKLTVVLFVVQGTAILLIVHTGNIPLTWLLTLIFGFTIGNIYMMQSLLVGELFGMVSFGAIYGVVSMVGQVGAGGGPFGIGFLHDATGGYGIPFTVTACLAYLAALIITFARPSQQRDEATTREVVVVPGAE
jgi:sugar phosphate permease